MAKVRISLCVGVALAAVGPWAAWAQVSPPPTVAYPGTVMGTPILTQDRGLSLPVPPVINVAAVNAQEAAALAASRNAGFTPNARCGFVAPWAVNGNRVVFAPGNGFGALGLNTCYSSGNTNSFINSAFAERRIENILVSNLIDNSIGNPGTVTVRGLGFGLPVLTVSTADLAAARQLLASMARAQSQRRYLVGNEVRTGGGPTVTSDRLLGQSLTGRDTLIFLVDQIGDTPARQQNIVGTQINCPSSTSTIGCTGGVIVDSASDTTTLNVHTITTLYITSSIERTITGGTTFFDVALTPLPAGAVHPAAQTIGFDQSSLFLARMLRGGDARLGVPLRGGGGKVSLFLEGVAGASDYRADGAIAASRGSAEGMRGGIVVAASSELTLGVAAEGTRGRWTLGDAALPESTRGDAWRIGGFAAWQPGRWRVQLAGFGGRQQVRSTASSTFGGGTSTARYDADVYGLGGELGIAIPAGQFTLTPSVGIDWLGWRAPAFTEADGLAPLSVAATSRNQLRSHAGLSADHRGALWGIGAFARGTLVSGDRQGLVLARDGVSQVGSFAITGPSSNRSEAEMGGHVSYAISPAAILGVSGAARIGGGVTSYSGQIGLRVTM